MPANAEVIERFRDAWEQGDIDAAIACLSPEVEILPIRARLEGTSYRGHDGYRRLLADFEQDWDDLRLVLEGIREEGEHVISSGRMLARGKASGVELDVPLVILFEMRDGLVARMETFEELDRALAAIGLAE